MDNMTPEQGDLGRDRRGTRLVEYVTLAGFIAPSALAGVKCWNSRVEAKLPDQGGAVRRLADEAE